MSDKREEDLKLLRALFTANLTCIEQYTFEEMFAWLQDTPQSCLSEKQRKWVRDKAKHYDVLPIDPAERNKNVPRGKEVTPAWNQSALPKKPPMRK